MDSMNEEIISQKQQDTFQEVSSDNSQKSNENHQQDIFADKFQELSDEFGKYCDEHNICPAIIIATDGKQQPMIFSNTDLLSTAAILASVLKPMKEEINQILNTD
jgi:predicted RNA-binding protein with PIN domain